MRVALSLRSIFIDIRYALRGLRNAPGYAFTVVLTLALGLGAVTAMLAVVDCVLLRPLDLPHPERLVEFSVATGAKNDSFLDYSDLQALQHGASDFSGISGYSMLPGPVGTADGSRIMGVMHASTNYFTTLGLSARMGRTFTLADMGAPVGVVTDAFWRDTLHGSPHAIGSTVHADGRVVTIIGVLSAGLRMPDYQDSPLLILPLHLNAKGTDEHGFSGELGLARVRPGVTMVAARGQAQAIFSRLSDHARTRAQLHLLSYASTFTGGEAPGLLALLAACGLLLAIACVNSANLQIARASVRAGEMRVRAALGAGRMRLLRQAATESLTVSLLGAGLGLLPAWGLVHWARAAYAHQFPRFDELALRPAVFAGCALLAVLAGLLAALAPGLAAMRSARTGLTAQPQRATRRSRLTGVLVAAQIALTCVLLATAGLFLRTFRALEEVPLGYDPHDVTEITLMPVDPTQSSAAFKQTFDNLLARLRALPGVASATTQTSLPFANFQFTMNTDFRITGLPFHKDDLSFISALDWEYARTLGVPLLQGRLLGPGDAKGGEYVCLVNQAFVRAYLKGQRILGHTVEFPNDATDGTDERLLKTPVRIVGVLGDVVSSQSAGPPPPTIFLNYQQIDTAAHSAHYLFGLAPQFAVRSTLPQAALDREIRAALKQAAPNMAEMQMEPMEDGLNHALDNQRLALRLASGFGVVALLLAGIGIYGVLAYSVAQRTREIGIRMALGSSRRGAVALVVRQAAWMCGVGLAVGLAAAWPAGRSVRSFLFGVEALDPLTLGSVALLLVLLCLMAAAVPARRAATVDPMTALREE